MLRGARAHMLAHTPCTCSARAAHARTHPLGISLHATNATAVACLRPLQQQGKRGLQPRSPGHYRCCLPGGLTQHVCAGAASKTCARRACQAIAAGLRPPAATPPGRAAPPCGSAGTSSLWWARFSRCDDGVDVSSTHDVFASSPPPPPSGRTRAHNHTASSCMPPMEPVPQAHLPLGRRKTPCLCRAAGAASCCPPAPGLLPTHASRPPTLTPTPTSPRCRAARARNPPPLPCVPCRPSARRRNLHPRSNLAPPTGTVHACIYTCKVLSVATRINQSARN